jgi:molybdopterin-containing oxidoreductase family iron-sulfur binding subunit
MNTPPIDDRPGFDAIRRRLGDARGRTFWRSLDELCETPAFRAFLEHEFPRHLAAAPEGAGRRHFLKLMAASLGVAGLAACTRQPEERIVPYVRQPEHAIPGHPLYFATAAPLGGYGVGILVESHDGRPTKIEGNPQHPASLGASDAMTQAALLGLYDPDRAQVLTHVGEIRPWSALVDAIGQVRAAQTASGGAGLRLLTGAVGSPTLAAQIEALLGEFPEARWHRWEPAGAFHARQGAVLAFGEAVETQYRFAHARVVVALDADFLMRGPGRIRAARDFAAARRLTGDGPDPARLYAAESTLTATGSAADHRIAVRSADVEAIARHLARELGVPASENADAPVLRTHRPWVDAVVAELRAFAGQSLVVPGDEQPPAVHALAHAINHRLGNAGTTVVYTAPVPAEPVQDDAASLRALVADMRAGTVECLVIVGGNPVYDAPADLDFAGGLDDVPLTIRLGLHDDETSERCHWTVPEAHFLESWSDVRAFDGTVSIVQPLIAPLYEGRSAHELLAALAGRPGATSHKLVREHWRGRLPGGDDESAWRRALHDGVVAGTASPPRPVTLRANMTARLPAPAPSAGGLELVLRPDPFLHDGRFANDGWLQEIPSPITQLTWDNAALLAPATAARLGLQNEDVAELRLGDRTLEAPVWIVPGHAADSVTLHLGYGRRRAGRVGTGAGVDAYALRTSEALAGGTGLTLRATGHTYPLAATQLHHAMEGRDLVRRATLAAYRTDPHFAQRHEPDAAESLYAPHPYEGNAWGMVIDLGACIGCNACVAACTAENNIPLVGKEEVARGHELQWLRVDRYYEGNPDAPRVLHQPVPCMHCENAPCEVVCPVNATVHSGEGLNEMVYNRCVGTRYCSNNCPYKVRRFNFFRYADWESEPLAMARNPDVSVRSRGVMEKCTYCVQRIEQVRIGAAKESRAIRDGEVVTACQQACPTEAIVFGNLNDPASRVARLRADPRNYGLLAELGTRPRTTYLAAVGNPNPTLEEPEET